MTKYVFVNGGTKKQRALVEDVAWWFCEKYFSRFKSFNIEIDLVNIEGEVNGWCMPIDRSSLVILRLTKNKRVMILLLASYMSWFM